MSLIPILIDHWSGHLCNLGHKQLIPEQQAGVHAWQWQVSVEARPEQLPHLHGSRHLFTSWWVIARWRCFIVVFGRCVSRPHPSDGNAADVGLQLTPGQATERLTFSLFVKENVIMKNGFPVWFSFHFSDPSLCWLFWIEIITVQKNKKRKPKEDGAYLLNLMEERMCSGPWSLAVCDTWRHYNNTS